MSIAPTPVREAWRPTLQRVAMSGGGSRMAAVSPSLSGAVAAIVMAVPTVGAVSEVTLVAPPPPVVAEEERKTELPASPGGGLHGSPVWSEPKALGESVVRMVSERLVAVHATEVVDIPSDDEANDTAEPPVSSRELAVVRSEAGPSGGLPEGDLEWPCPEDPAKVLFILWASQESQL